MPAQPPPPDLTHAVLRLREGRLVAFPTETVYGLAADARNPAAVRHVFDLKQRPPRNPLIVHVPDVATAKTLVSAWPAEADALAREFWPGPLTLVLPRSLNVHDVITAGGPTVAIRCPDHPLALALLRAFGGPLVGPSANPSGTVSPTRAEHVSAAFTPQQVHVLDGGPCRVGIESTVLSLAHSPARILRQGAISADDIQRVLHQPVEIADNLTTSADTPLPSPGLLERHYAPSAPLILLTHDDDVVLPPDSVLLALPPSRRGAMAPRAIPMPTDAEHYAARLYEALREADTLKPSAIYVELPQAQSPLWNAVIDRLRRAAAPA
ncbi:MAG: L-threonylcarbamoyladenylate synthase [Phycisphaerales bacterium]